MRLSVMLLGLLLALAGGGTVWAGSGKVSKVLPHRLDAEGRHALSPSLYERDAYQAELRRDRSKQHGWGFDIQWKARRVPKDSTWLKVELLTTESTRESPIVLRRTVKPAWWGSRWDRIVLDGAAYRRAGDLIAWRVTLWSGEELLGSHQSFLW